MSIRSSYLSVLAAAGLLAACGGNTVPAAMDGPAPAGPSQPAAQARQTPPPPMPARPLEFPAFDESTLPNGMRLIVVEDHDQPVANVNLYISAGSATDPAAKAGLAALAADVITRGTATRSAQEISNTIEGAGGSLSAFAGADFVGIAAGVLAQDLPLAFDLLGDVALRPSFPEDQLEIARTRTLSGLQVELSEPGSVANRQFQKAIYGEQHPYAVAPVTGRPSVASPATIWRASTTGTSRRTTRCSWFPETCRRHG